MSKEIIQKIQERNQIALSEEGQKEFDRRAAQRQKIIRMFTYHAPHGDQVERYNRIREQGLQMALTIFDNTPESAEQTLAIRSLHQCTMSANSAIAINED